MKRYQFYILLSLIFLVASCQKKEGVQFYNLGSEFFISSPGYTSLDSQAVFSINNISKNLTTVNITNLGGTLANDSAFTSSYTGSIAINSDGNGSATLIDSDLGLDGIGASAKFEFDAVFDGKPFSRYYTLNETDPISVTYPAMLHMDSTYYFNFKIRPVTATVESVTVYTKVSANGTYNKVTGTFHAVDSIPIKGSDYNLGDTLFVKVTGTAGVKTASTVTDVVIKPNSYSKLATFTLDSTANKAFDLVNDSIVSVGYAGADIALLSNSFTGGYTLGFSSPNNTLFVMGTASDYAFADKITIASTDFSSAITANNDVSAGEVYIFKTMRNGKPYYGVMKIIQVEKPQGVLADSYITIEYKH